MQKPNKSIEQLCRVLAELKSTEECRAFLEDLCTIRELQDMAQRLETAILLDQGCSYLKISEQVGISTATISRVNRALVYGADGYRLAIDRLNDTEENHDDP